MAEPTLHACRDTINGPIYDWQRFWYKPGSENRLKSGFLEVYQVEDQFIAHPDVLPFENISSTPCLVLLGESGMGKSHAICSEYIKTLESGIEALFVDLGIAGSEITIYRNLFDSEKFADWLNGSHNLHLFLDGLDECQSRLITLPKIILTELENHRDKLDRLSLRIACRTGSWNKETENGLQKLWGTDLFSVYELAQLKQQDVRLAATQNDIDDEAFLREVVRKEIEPLASRPVTLKMLLSLYRDNNGSLTANKAELYYQGCLQLCRERTESWQEVRKLDEYKCVAIAARIAYVGIFSGRPIIWKSLDENDIPKAEATVTVSELAGGKEYYIRNEFNQDLDVDDKAIQEVLSSGLFSRSSADSVAWTHLSYAEFLAAWYLKEQNFPILQIKSLVFHEDSRLIPQLYDTAYWIVSLMPGMFREVVKTDPQILLGNSIDINSDAEKSELVSSILQLCEEGVIEYRAPSIVANGHKFNHANLVAQLQPYIIDSSKPPIARSVAIKISEACELKELQNDLVKLVTSEAEPVELRKDAAETIYRVGESSAKAELRSLVNERLNSLPDSLKGYILSSLWPDHISASDLFDFLQFPNAGWSYDKYSRFLSEDLAENLKASDLPVALAWVEQQQRWAIEEIVQGNGRGRILALPSAYLELINGIVAKTLENLGQVNLIDSVARIVCKNLNDLYSTYRKDLEKAFQSDIWQDSSIRHRLLESIVNILLNEYSSLKANFYSALVYFSPLVPQEDFMWLMETYERESSVERRKIIIGLLRARFNSGNKLHVDCFLKAITQKQQPELEEAFSFHVETVSLNSDQAKAQKQQYQERLDLESRVEEDKEESVAEAEDIRQQILSLLSEFDSGNLDAWWQLNYWMAVKPGTNQLHEYKVDLVELATWHGLDPSVINQILESAKAYILGQKPDLDNWTDSSKTYRPAQSAYKSFYLLEKQEPGFLAELSERVWQSWTPIIFEYSQRACTQNDIFCDSLLQKVYHHAKDQTITSILSNLDEQNSQQSRISIPSSLEKLFDQDLAVALIEYIKSSELTLQSLKDLLLFLIRNHSQDAITLAKEIINQPRQKGEDVVASSVLMSAAEDAGWDILWPRFQDDSDFGKAVVESAIATDDVFNNVGAALSESKLTELFIWLTQRYPYSEDPSIFGSDRGIRHYVVDLKQHVIGHLQEKGTSEAVLEMERLKDMFPDLKGLNSSLLAAQLKTRSETWNRPTAQELLSLISNKQARLIRSGSDLLNLVYESLERFESKLQDNETLAVNDVWNEVPSSFINRILVNTLKLFYKSSTKLDPKTEKDKKQFLKLNSFQPKDENALSNLIKRHLDSDIKPLGVVIGREVEINRGDFTDLRVDCPVKDKRTGITIIFSVIIEVKGTWNRELNTSLNEQLFDRYLSEISCQDGIYLVGWFNCDKWSDQDYRKADASRYTSAFPTLPDAKVHFNTEAEKLSQPNKQVKAFVLDVSLP